MAKLKLGPAALSVLETDVLEHVEDDIDDVYTVIREAFHGDYLLVDRYNSDDMARALTNLSNDCDYLGNGRELDEDERKLYRRAAGAFGTLAIKARRVGK